MSDEPGFRREQCGTIEPPTAQSFENLKALVQKEAAARVALEKRVDKLRQRVQKLEAER